MNPAITRSDSRAHEAPTMAPDQTVSAGCSALVYNDEQLEKVTITSPDVYLFQVDIGTQPTNRAKT